MSDLDLEGGDLSAPTGPEDSTPAPDLRASVDVSVLDSLAYLDTGVDSLDHIAELDPDRSEARSELDGATRGTKGALEPVLLALIVLKAFHDQDRDRRLRASAAVSRDPQHPAMPTPRLRAGA